MELWFSERHTDNVQLQIKIEKQLFAGESDFQKIDVFQTTEFGKMLVLDGVIMTTERDEFIYHEMITHLPMAVNPNIRKILVIGAGDGGTVNQLIKYDSIEKIDVVEIDRMVVDVCREFFPMASAFEDERVTLYFEDGLRFIRTVQNAYDLIIVDSTDPFGPGEGLFTKEFYGNCYKALHADGILVNQHESPFYENDAMAMRKAHQCLSKVFEIAKVYQLHIPTYPSGHWLFGFASKRYDTDPKAETWKMLDIHTKYYNTDIHKGCFMLPTYVQKMLDVAKK